ncbi:MAG: hypothetical protein IJZ95_06885 [Oscillospiraceae bacterium]|nr:hypothetical protein [Oscillospiraceae bacterium]
MKKLLPILLMLLIFTGCSDTTELGDRAIIQLAAIDHTDGGFQISALLFSAGGSGGTIDVKESNVIKVTGRGSTVSEAISDLSLIDGKEIYMSEAKLLVLGSGFEQEDIPSVLTMLYRDMRCSLNMPVCCADSAEMLTDMEFTEGITAAEKPYSMIINGNLSGASPKTTLLDILSDNEGGRATLIPMFSESANGSGMTKSKDGKTAVLSGSRLVAGGRLTYTADMDETAGYMLLSGLSDSTSLSITDNTGETSCEAYGIEVQWKNDAAKITAHFRSRSGSPLSEAQEQLAHKRLCNIISAGIGLYKHSLGSDLS